MNKTKLVQISFITDMNNDNLEILLDALINFDIPEIFGGRDAIITTEEYKE